MELTIQCAETVSKEANRISFIYIYTCLHLIPHNKMSGSKKKKNQTRKRDRKLLGMISLAAQRREDRVFLEKYFKEKYQQR